MLGLSVAGVLNQYEQDNGGNEKDNQEEKRGSSPTQKPDPSSQRSERVEPDEPAAIASGLLANGNEGGVAESAEKRVDPRREETAPVETNATSEYLSNTASDDGSVSDGAARGNADTRYFTTSELATKQQKEKYQRSNIVQRESQTKKIKPILEPTRSSTTFKPTRNTIATKRSRLLQGSAKKVVRSVKSAAQPIRYLDTIRAKYRPGQLFQNSLMVGGAFIGYCAMM